MARKSRRNQLQTSAESQRNEQRKIEQKAIATAAYARLSVEKDGEISDTLETQVTMIRQFIASQENLQLADVYIDNGYTGTNFDRPEFIRLMDDVRSGRIQCIVVKDLSRFGRNYLEVGYYLETFLPSLNVRFIAITDEFDSSREEDRNSLSVPIKNMVNALYAKDISKKQCVAAAIRRKQEDAMPQGIAPFGYRFSEDKSHFVPDDESAVAVRMIFQWTMMGLAPVRIAERLSLTGYATPGERRKELLTEHKVNHSGKWAGFMVRNILQNPQYVGDVVLGRKRSALYLSKQNERVSPEDWVVHSNVHEPLVSRDNHREAMKSAEEYQLKNEVVKKRTEIGCKAETDYFEGMIFCAECRQKMYFIRCYHDFDKTKDETGCYICSSNVRHSACSGHRIYADYLKIVVMDQIHHLIRTMCDRKMLLEKIKTAGSKKNILSEMNSKIQRLAAQRVKEEERKALLYENYAEGLLDEEDYLYMKAQRTEAIERLRNEQLQAEQALRKSKLSFKKYAEMTVNLEKYLSDHSFSPALVKQLIERIYIGTDGRIEVCFRCNDTFMEVDEMLREATK